MTVDSPPDLDAPKDDAFVARVTFTMTPQAYVAARRGTVDRGGIALLAFLSVTTLPIAAFGLATGTRGIALFCLLVGALALGLLLDVQLLGPRRSYQDRGLGDGPSTWTFTDDGLHVVEPAGVRVAQWDDYARFAFTEEFLLLVRAHGVSDIAPLGVFDSHERRVVRTLLADVLPRERTSRLR